MKKLLIFLSILFALTASAKETKKVDPTQPVKEFVLSWVETFNKNNVASQVAFYHESEKTEVLVSAGFWHRGFTAIKKAYEDDQKLIHYFDSKLQKLAVSQVGDCYFVSFEHLFKYKYLENHSRYRIHIRTTMAITMIKGKYKIVQEHSSPLRGIERMKKL